jgi:hypothetical protein
LSGARPLVLRRRHMRAVGLTAMPRTTGMHMYMHVVHLMAQCLHDELLCAAYKAMVARLAPLLATDVHSAADIVTLWVASPDRIPTTSHIKWQCVRALQAPECEEAIM